MTAERKIVDYKILEHHIEDTYKIDIDGFTRLMAEKYINDYHQREIFLQKGVWLKVKLNYIGALILTKGGKEIFTPKDIRDVIREQIFPSVKELSDDYSGQTVPPIPGQSVPPFSG